MKKFLVPVTFMMSTYVEVEAVDIEEAIHEACGVDLSIDSVDSWEYVGDSWEIDEEGIEEVPNSSYDPDAVGDFSTWDKMPGGF